MIDEETPTEKTYFSIGEVAAMFELNISNVRYWENEFDILKPKKNAKGDRFFTRKDVENIRIIKELIKGRGYTLEGAKKKLSENNDALKERMKVLDSLEDIKSFLTTMKIHLEESGEEETISPVEEKNSETETVTAFEPQNINQSEEVNVVDTMNDIETVSNETSEPQQTVISFFTSENPPY